MKLKPSWKRETNKAGPGTLQIHKDGKFKDVNFKKAVTAGKNKLSGLKLRMMPWKHLLLVTIN